MDCTVVFKWERDPETARVSADGDVDWGRAQPAAADDDHAVLAVARGLASDGTVTAVTVSGGDASWAAARGAAATTVIDGADGLDTSARAAALGAAAALTGNDVVLVGDSVWNRALPGALASALGRPLIAQVRSAEVVDGALHVTRRTADGDEVLAVNGAVVLAVAAESEEKGAPGMKDVLKARKSPQTKTSPDALGTSKADSVLSRGTRIPQTTSCQMFSGPTAFADLAAALRADGVL